MSYILDTNAVINYLDASFPPKKMSELHEIVDSQIFVSVITKMEALGYSFKSEFEQNIFETFMKGAIVLGLNEEIVQKTIDLRKLNKIKLPDAIISATALVFNLKLISQNLSDFKNIKGLKLVDFHQV